LISANKLNSQQKAFIKKSFVIADFEHLTEEEIKTAVKQWFYKMLNQMVNNLANENADANENIIVAEKGKEGTGEKPLAAAKVVYPFGSDDFAQQWQAWKQYRTTEHRQRYRSPESEQA